MTLDDIRRAAVARSLFPPATLQGALDALSFVQADPIRAPARAQDLTLRHRVVNYRAGDLERHYSDLDVHEDFFVNYGFVTNALQGLMHPRGGPTPWTAARGRYVRTLVEFVRARGSVHPREVDEHFAHGTVTNYWGGSSNATTHLLDQMHYRGLLRVVRREAGIRIYAAHEHPAVARDAATRRAHLDALVDVVVGTQALKRLPVLVEESRAGGRPRADVDPYEDVSFPLGLAVRSDPVKAYVTIIEGCDDYCAFCVVPYTRGHERMRPKADILAEVRHAVDHGRREIQLLGQIVNHYQAPDDPACDFAQLVADVHEVPGVERIRFASPHPRHVCRRLIDVIRDVPEVCKHLHLPVQSGSDRVLAAMRRRYTGDHYRDLVGALRENVPGIALSSDIIVGFPGETMEDFEHTLALVREVDFQSLFSFKYSPRPGTLAARRMPDDVPEAEKTRRILALQELQRGIQLAWHRSLIGTEAEVLIDSPSRRRDGEVAGRTSGNTIVNVPGPTSLLGARALVQVTEAGPNSLRGELLAVLAPADAGVAG